MAPMQRPPPPAAVFAGGDCGEAAAAAVVTTMPSAEAALPAVDGALAAQAPAAAPKPPKPQPTQERAAKAKQTKRKRTPGYWKVYELRKTLEAGTSRYTGRAYAEEELEKRRARLVMLEEALGRASRKHVVEPILEKMRTQHAEQQQMHQSTHDMLHMMLGKMDPEELACSPEEALAATLLAEVAVKERKRTLKIELKRRREAEALKKKEEKAAQAEAKRRRTSSQDETTLPRRQTSAMSPMFRS